jgi:microcystin-dependent protein
MFQNRTAEFLYQPTHTYDLFVKRNATIAGDLIVGGDIAGDIKAINFYARGNFYLDNHILIPAGTIMQFAGNNAEPPGGWLYCDGSTLSRDAYPHLFNAIGTIYNDGATQSTQFKLPDLRGKCAIGSGDGGAALTNRTVGDVGGEETHTLSTAEMPQHSHQIQRKGNGDADACDPADGNNPHIINADSHATESSACTTDRVLSDGHGGVLKFNTYNTGSGNAHNNMQPFIVLNFLIKY